MWLYRLQQRLALTTPESNVLLVIAFLLLLGLTARHFQNTPPTLPESVYQEIDEAFDDARAATGSTIPNESEDEAGAPPPDTRAEVSEPSDEEDVLVYVNTATVIELQQLPGIGPALADRIVVYRDEHGAFQEAEELTRVRGIGPRTLEQVKSLISLDLNGP